jgi:deaminated glutathione amidase
MTLKAPGTCRMAAVQMCSSRQMERNLERAVRRVREAAEAGADIVALPENFALMGTDQERAQVAQDLQGEIFRTLQTAARENAVILLAGSYLTRTSDAADPRPHNTSVLLDRRGNPAGVYHKIHLFDVSLGDGADYQESGQIRPGNRVVTADLEGITFGLSICYDLRFPELYRALSLRGAQVAFVPAAFTLITGRDHWFPLLRARAIENQMYLVAPAQFGQHDDGRRTYGRSAIVDPWGTVVAAAPDRECVIYAEFDAGYLADVRSRIPVFGHRRPDIY